MTKQFVLRNGSHPVRQKKLNQMPPTDQELNLVQSQGNEDSKGEEASQPVKIGDKEFTSEQLTELSKKAGQYDELLPEFTRKTQKLKELEEEKEDGEWEYPEEYYSDKKPEEKPNEPNSDGDKLKQKALNELEEAFGPKIEERVNKQLEIRLKQSQEDTALENELKRLETDYPGGEGKLPKFDRKEIIKHANKTGIFNPEVAYKHLHGETIDEFKEKEREEKKEEKKGVFVEKPGGGETAPKLPKEKTPATFDEAEEAMQEMLQREDK